MASANEPRGVFIVHGIVYDRPNGRPVPGIGVRAFDKDLRSLQDLLGDDHPPVRTNAEGYYRIEYTASRFRRAEKKSADLIVRAYAADGTTVRAESSLHPNAPAEARIDFSLGQPKDDSEYARLVATLTLLLEGVQLADLTDDDLRFLQRQTDEPADRLAILRRSAVLERDTAVPVEAFYGLGRVGLPLDLRALTAVPRDRLRGALLRAIDERIIPARLRDRLDAILDRLVRLGVEAGNTIARRVLGRLRDARDDAPARYLTVRALDLDADPAPTELTPARADDRGLFALTYLTARPADGRFPSRRLRLRVFADQHVEPLPIAPAGSDVFRVEIEFAFPPDESAETGLRVRLPRTAADPPDNPPPVRDVLDGAGVPLPDELGAFLGGKGIRTLDDVRRFGGLARLPELPVPADHPAVTVLQAQADLHRVSVDLAVNQRLIERGFDRVAAIAETPRPEFVLRAADVLKSDFKAATLHATSVAQTHVLDSALAETAARRMTATRNRPGPDDLFPDPCCCPDCLTAMGPLAYLADLTQFALTHVRVGWAVPWSLAAMCDYLGQPFDRLVVTCDAVDARVRQVRLAVEALRKQLTRFGLTQPQQHQVAAAERQYVQDAYRALLLRVGTTLEEVRLARAAGTDPTRGTALADRLGIDPGRLQQFFIDDAFLLEPVLEELFGLVDTDVARRDPLAAAAEPKLLTWRVERLRKMWETQDRPDDRPRPWYEDPEDPDTGARPLIDPDLLCPGDFRHSAAGDPAFDLYEVRKAVTEADFAQYRADLAADFPAALGAAFPGTDLTALRNKLQDPATAAAALKAVRETLRLNPEAFLRLVELRDKANPGPLSPEELDEVADILTWAKKVARFPTWIAEENAVAGLWGFEHFWIALQEPDLRRWRGSVEARAEWQQALRARMRPPIIDPDLLSLGGGDDNFEVLDTNRGFGLFLDRQQALQGRADNLRALRQGAASDEEKLEDMIQEGLGIQVADLTALAEQRRNGKSVEARLNQHALSAAGFNRLLRLADLAATGEPLLETEWEEAEAILVQSWKLRQYGAWRDEEAGRCVVLGPDEFRIVTPPGPSCREPAAPSGVNRVVWPPPVPSAQRTPFQRWRAPEEDYRAWQDRLQARIDQRTTLAQALRDAVSAAEAAVLPRFRDALIEAAPLAGVPPTETKANFLSRNLMTDFADSGGSETTRVSHAFASLQALLTTLRLGKPLELLTGAVLIDVPGFDLAWRWIGGYATWRAAVLVFLYPENIAIPSLRPVGHQTPAFRDVVRKSGGTRRVSPKDACQLAREYAEYLGDVRTLVLEAGCQVTVPIRDRADCGASSQGERCVLFLFARSGVKGETAYWTVYDPGRPEPDAQFPWAKVEPYGGHQVKKIVGTAPFKNDAGRLQVYLFAKVAQGGKEEFGFWTLDVDNWAAAPGTAWGWGNWIDLALPDDQQFADALPTHGFTAAVVQTHGQADPPRVVLASGSGVYERPLNARGDGWGWKFSAVDVHTTAITFERVELGRAGADSQGGYYLAFAAHANPVAYTVTTTETVTEEIDVQGECGYEVDEAHHGHKPPPGCGKKHKETVTHEKQVTKTIDDPPFPAVVCVRIQNGGFQAAVPAMVPREDDQVRVTGGHYFPEQGIFYFWTSSLAGAMGAAIDQPTYAATAANGITLRRVATTHSLPVHYVPVSTSATGKDRAKERLAWTTHSGNPAYHGIVLATGDAAQPGPPEILGALKAYPVFQAPTDIVLRLDGPSLHIRKSLLAQAYADNSAPLSVARYLDEAFYYVPVQLALALQRGGHYVEALDVFRTVYDYTAPKDHRRINPLLVNEATRADSYARGPGWLQDPLNPHAALGMRQDGNTRFVALCIVRCLLDFADAEFARDTSESVPRARQLYLLALDLLDDEDILGPNPECADIISGPMFQLRRMGIPAVVVRRLSLELRRVPTASVVRALVADIVSADGALDRLAEVADAARRAAVAPTLAALLDGERERQSARRAWAVADAQIDRAARVAGAAAATAFEQAVVMVTGMPAARLARADLPWLREERVAKRAEVRTDVARLDPLRPTAMARLAKLALDDPAGAVSKVGMTPGDYWFRLQTRFCVPPNPTARTLRLRAEANLVKIRTCRNFAGLQRALEPYTAATDATSGLPTIGPGGQLILTGVSQARPTPYRYSVLIERAKQLVELAGRFEGAMLDAIRNKENEEYTLLRARQDLKLARAGVRLQDLKLTEAGQGVKLAQLQQSRAQFQVDHFATLIEEGLSGLESASLALLGLSAALQGTAGIMSFIAAGLPSSVVGPAVTYSPQGSMGAVASGLSSLAAATSTTASILSTQASYERRAEEWAFQKGLAEQDVAIGAQQVALAESQVAVVEQERTIANLQADNAEAVVEFLSNKLLTPELYTWMAGVLEDIYRYFLQEAAAIAQTAADQLSFERQETPPPYIKADYWATPQEGLGNGGGPDRRGLTGSARLTQDIYQLDQYAFVTNKRKLQLARTISLARLVPLQFAQFRETGVLRFRTPMELFDRDFPGHYLRLVKRLRVSVVALIPVSEGIRATLSAVGPSRVVIGGPDGFQTVAVRRPPESAAYTSPINATGLFDLDTQPEMLVPFEGMGVDAGWEFRLPKASNPFDFATIADVILTVEYTALDSPDYRTQVVAALGRDTSIDVSFSFRHQFADAWYDLHNPDQTATPLAVAVATTRADFAPHLTNLRLEQLAVLVAVEDRPHPLDAQVLGLRFAERGASPEVGGDARPLDGLVTTRGGTGTPWLAMLGREPIGRWRLTFPDNTEVRELFARRAVKDIVLIATCRATLPEYFA